MSPTLLLIFSLPFIESDNYHDNFDEIIHQNINAFKYAKRVIQEVVKIAKEGEDTNDRAMFVHCKGTDYLRNFVFLKNYDYLNNTEIVNADVVNEHEKPSGKLYHTTKLYFEVVGNDSHLSFQLWQNDYRKGPWELYRVEDLKCNLPKRKYLKEAIEMSQFLYFTEGEWKKKKLNIMFIHDSEFRFCDGSVERYFFHRNDTLSKDPVVLHDLVEFSRATGRIRKGSFLGFTRWETLSVRVAFYQMDVTLNGRRMQLEYDDDWNMFRKGREYTCNGDKVKT